MSIEKFQSAITAKIWQAIAQGEIDLSPVPREEVAKLVSLVVDAALEAVDAEIESPNPSPVAAASAPVEGDEEEERILWEGRPFLSLTRHYQITTQRIRITAGLLSKDREDIELVRIQDLDQNQTLTERAMNIGDIYIRSHDASDPQMVLENIKDPQQVHEILRRAVMKAREKYRLSYREEM